MKFSIVDKKGWVVNEVVAKSQEAALKTISDNIFSDHCFVTDRNRRLSVRSQEWGVVQAHVIK